MKNPMSPVCFRGDILRCTAVTDPNHAKHVGEDYILVRTLAGADRDLLGNEVGTTRFVFNLVNTKTGKARVSEMENQFVSNHDGIRTPIRKTDLEQHFGMTFRLATDEKTIAPAVKVAVDKEVAKQPVQFPGQLQRVLGSIAALGIRMVPVYDNGGNVLAYAAV